MKTTKKLAGILLALVMVLAMTVPAFATGTNSIRVNNAQANETYKIYKMMDLSVNAGMTAYRYTVNTNWTAFFTGTGEGAAYVTIDVDAGHVTWNEGMDDSDKMTEFGKLAADYANGKPTAAADITPATDETITFGNLDPGYYLITSTNGTLAIVDTTPTNPNPEIDEKNADPSLDKQVQEDSTTEFGTENSAQIGDTVSFQVSITLKKGAKNYVMHDTMADGLTYTAGSVAIEGLTKGVEYTVAESTAAASLADGCTFEISFAQNYLDTITADTTLTVAYAATLNEKADLTNGETNQAVLKWGDKSSVTSQTTTKTYQFEVLKYAAGDTAKTPLAGATFQLKDKDENVVNLIKLSNTEYRVANGDEAGKVDSFTTVAAGNIVIKGVDLDTYQLVETEAPKGYNKLAALVSVTVENTNAVIAEIENSTGAELPSTGGVGTTVFYIVGGVLLVGAGVLLVVRKRMSALKEFNK